MFADSAKIYIRSGKGGDGHVSFRRELFVAAGGPDGGDGGRGGDLIFEMDEGLNTLNDFRHVRKYFASDGEPGGTRRCHGKDGMDMVVKVPPGTVVKDAESGKVITDINYENPREVVLKGGRGGKGNQHYATATMQVPQFAQPGKPGKELTVLLELKVIADVGLVGFPNVGKSTFLARVTNAKPKIANYHFTTIEPNLGVVKTASGDSFVIADIPGIIEGASEGVGLGIQFLRHVERTRLLLHVIDVSGSEGRDPVEDYHTINEELKKYSEKLATRKQILVANKIDVMQDDERLKELEELAKKEKLELFKISGVTGEGISELLNRVSEVLKTLPKEEIVEEEDKVIYTLDDDKEEFTVRKDGDTFVVEGKAVNRLMGRINIDDNESMYYFQKKLKELGIEDELKRQGICEGDYVKMLNWTFEWYQ